MRDGSKASSPSGGNAGSVKNSVWKDCLFAMRLYYAGNSLVFILNVLLVTIGAVLPAVGTLASKPLVDAAIGGRSVEAFQAAAVILAVYLAEPLAQNVYYYLTGMLKEEVTERATLTVAGALDGVSNTRSSDILPARSSR